MGGARLRRIIFIVAATVALAFAFVARARGEWLWDDVYLVENNRELVEPGGLRTIVTHDLWGGATGEVTQLYHPVPVVLHALEVAAFGVSLRSMRVVDVLLHALNGALLYIYLRRLGRSEAAATLGLAVFLLHPVTTEPVMWLSAHDLPGMAFTLGACLAVGRSWPRAAAAAGCAFFAFLSKELYIVAPLLAVIPFLPRADDRRGAWRFAVLAMGALGMAFAIRRAIGIVSTSDIGLGALIRAAGTIVLHYGLELATFTNQPTIESYAPLSFSAAILVLVAALALIAALARFAPPAAHGALWIGIALAPSALALPYTGVFANRYAYLPLAGFALLLSALWDRLLSAPSVDRLAPILMWTPIPVVLLLALFTAGEASRWSSGLLLFGADVEREPDDARALYHYGHAVWRARGCADALPLYERAVARDPAYQRAWHNVAGCLINQRRFKDAVAPAEQALALAPDDPRAEYNLGTALAFSGDLADGIAHLERSAALRPGSRATDEALESARALAKKQRAP